MRAGSTQGCAGEGVSSARYAAKQLWISGGCGADFAFKGEIGIIETKKDPPKGQVFL